MRCSLLGLLACSWFLCLCVAALIGMEAASAAERRAPISLGAATTIEADVSSPRISLDDDPIAAFIVDIIPGGATFRVRYDGELVMQWDSTQVKVGLPFAPEIVFDGAVSSGEAELNVAYAIQPSFWIDYDELFEGWPYPAPIEGDREERLPLMDRTLKSVSLALIEFTESDGLPP